MNNQMMELKRYFDAKTTGMGHNERFLLIPNFTESACEVIKTLLDPENPHTIHMFMIFDSSPSSNNDRPDIIDLNQTIDDIDEDRKLYIGTIIDAMPYVKNGCVLVKTLKPIHDFVSIFRFEMMDFSVIVNYDSCDKNSIIVGLRLSDPKSCRSCVHGHKEFRFVCDKGKPFWM